MFYLSVPIDTVILRLNLTNWSLSRYMGGKSVYETIEIIGICPSDSQHRYSEAINSISQRC